MQLVLFIGIQATGKSTFYRERFLDTHIRLNLDMLKTRHRESVLFRACIEGKAKVVIDNTNPTKDDRSRYIEPASRARFQIVGYFFESTLQEALRRNAAREGDARIPDAGLRSASRRLEPPSFEEGFDELHSVRMDGRGGFEVKAWREDT